MNVAVSSLRFSAHNCASEERVWLRALRIPTTNDMFLEEGRNLAPNASCESVG